MLLKDKVVIITGGAGLNGLGFASARMMAEQGASIVILDLARAHPEDAAARIGAQHLGIVADVTDKSACERAVQTALAKFGRVDVLVNNAGITQPRKTVDISIADYEAVLDVSLRGSLYMSQAVLPAMQAAKSGSIICISSVSAQRGGGIVGGPHYSAAKGGVLGLARAMAREFGIDGIRVNCVTPGLIETDIMKGLIPDDKMRHILDQIPMNRLGEPSDIAGCVTFLASSLSKYCTGMTLDVNGGMLIH
ncbi:NAD(P)-dependent dehydrogenase (short-subunit alcohol dehydrogenase family) [Jezberella montanilacus]|jgi:NAD(P)-dependent dehydrogenase (short-subunit alcohol dehydrogenase family)|uniref:NAD(P)-dependent dehydrogenase (Short-subunit alcohol dehydrogenase family) n=1 Tax=Jezberella montanilacus TaxID=323426 RepID=A0A2T0XB06_9BURK|nr:SDR family NAD(P)-dependent oxidoreductase [Jezberella montanilacus]PRY96064.1 NAD(P)-dependent dehydrogenase (short-subunit alcohol dehydrogenase family) [Jezberella montanilacus]